ncbi:hypothetical protein [Halalkalicoccus ordinarius]|uniref:hypothetical protein n=1 Tax=Halalkalicoccus ordinarius TaxID=3116651 RepID=UPI00300E934A
MTIDCTYCGSDVRAHEPLFLEREEDGERRPAGRFCNYACLSTYVEEEGLVTGATCEFEPGSGT